MTMTSITKLTLAAFCAVIVIGFPANSFAQNHLAHANYDMEASGYLTPAGMPPAAIAYHNQIAQVGYADGGCDSGACDSMPGMGGMMSRAMMGGQDTRFCGSCGSQGGCGCNGGGGMLGGGGLLGKMKSQGGSPCFFCRGSGCTACKELPFGYAGSVLAGAVGMLRPYEGAQLCQQRWYDLSVEALVLDRNIGGGTPGVITTLGQGPTGTPVLTLDDVGSGDLAAGIRLSGAMLAGPGGNLELTYMGGNEWDGNASASSAAGGLFSFISDFGTNPANGFDDTDDSLRQSLTVESVFHSAEVNYRRRTMFPYCRFQSSWLVGLRYLRYDDLLRYSADGPDNNAAPGTLARFFDSTTSTKNNLFGPQAGFDFWWNAAPGISIGFGAKGAWMQNDVDRRSSVFANSIGPLATPGGQSFDDGDQQGTLMADCEFKMVYRFSHSLSVRSSYYALAVEDIAFGGLDAATARSLIANGTAVRDVVFDDLVLQGFTAGIEYMW